MRALIPVLALLSLQALARDDTVEIAGVPISNGMTRDEVRALIPGYAIHPVDIADGVTEDVEIWSISSGKWAGGGEIHFRDGRVARATRNLRSTDDVEAYEMFVLLNEWLAKLTGGQDACVMIRTGVPQRIFPQSDTGFILPDKILTLWTASRSEQDRNVSFQESTRINPVPESERVRKGIGEHAHCVFVDANPQARTGGEKDG